MKLINIDNARLFDSDVVPVLQLLDELLRFPNGQAA